jgi:hypothetical protein
MDLPNGLYPYQTQVSDDLLLLILLANGDEYILNQCRQSGKTEGIVITILTLSVYFTRMLKQSFRIGIFTPAASQATQIVKDRLKTRYTHIKPLLAQLGLRLDTGDSYYSELFVIRNDSAGVDARVRCFSIGERTNVTGETLNLIIIEQAEDVDPLKMEQDVFPMAASNGGVRVLSGTPHDVVINTYFYDACEKRQNRKNIKFVKWEEAAKYNPRYAAYALQMMNTLGENSIAWKTQYELKWAGGVDKFTDRLIMDNLIRKVPFSSPLIDGVPMFIVGAGWDVAKESDRSVVTYGFREALHTHIKGWLEFEGTDYTDQEKTVAQMLVNEHVRRICVDSAGVGDPVVDGLKNELRELAGKGFTWARKVKIEGIPTNNKFEEDKTAKLMMDVWKREQIDYPSYKESVALKQRRQRDRFVNEFLDLNKVWRANLLRLEAPEGEDTHDDYPKSCGLMLRSISGPSITLSMKEVDL